MNPQCMKKGKDQEGPEMNLLRGSTLSTVALTAPVMLRQAAADRVPWSR